ncbi:MAG: DUF420 domain-containing protein [Planctomyces sp.]|nr:DUF420 domain-containing protein [Planctomyces sp.]
MQRGFLGYNASPMLDVVVCALVLVVPALIWTVWLARSKKNYRLHKIGQLVLAVVLLAAVGLFELDMRLQGGWERIVNRDPDQPRLTGAALDAVRQLLYVHLAFAISTPFLWAATIALALRRFRDPPAPGPHSRLHVRLGWISVADLVATSVTGLAFYYMAFVRTA